MAATVNIRRDVKDKFYRYKMPVLLTKIEGKGNGIKTVFPNMADVARALNRPASYPTKFFGCELGAQATFNDDTERYIVNGAHDQDRMRDLLDSFINKFVLCASCKNPETELLVSKDDWITADCKACGHRGDVENKHKLCTFIVKNPPKKASKKGKKGAAGADSIAGQPGQIDGEDDDQDELSRKINEGAQALLSEEAAAKLIAQREAEEDWGDDTSAEAVAKRMAQLGVGASLLADDDEDGGDKYTAFAATVTADMSNADIYTGAQEVSSKSYKVLVPLVPALFTDEIVAELPTRLALLAKMTTNEKDQKALLGGLERFFADHTDLITPGVVGKCLLQLFEADILTEEVLLHWSTHVSSKYAPKDISKKVRKAADPFIEWLKSAESESEDEDE
ncbi:eukaryotic translation initiation factor 5 [Rhodotorula kratochvilovae]